MSIRMNHQSGFAGDLQQHDDVVDRDDRRPTRLAGFDEDLPHADDDQQDDGQLADHHSHAHAGAER